MRRSALPLLLGALFASIAPALAAPGDLDPTFGGDGIVTTDLGGVDRAWALAVQSDGRVVLAGASVSGGNSNIALARYTVSGALDTSFGGDGIVITDLGGGLDQARGVVALADGSLIVAGLSDAGGDTDFVLARYHADGSLDTSFGTGGIAMLDVAGGDDGALALARQSNGKLLSAGFAYTGVGTDLAVVRHDAGGALDTSFGSGGVATVAIGFDDALARAAILPGDGRVVVAGTADFLSTGDEAVVARLTSAGTFDPTFDDDGVVTPTLSNGDDIAHAVAIQADGRIVVVGEAAAGASHHITVLRRLTTGAPDTSFDLEGVALYPLGSSSAAHGVLAQEGGRILVVGQRSSGAQSDIVLLRLLGDGGFDPGFGSSGLVVTPVGAGDDEANAVASSGGKLLVAGATFNGSNEDFAVLRYIGSDCGDGNVDGGEECDDGNLTGGDCCSATCQFEANGSACAADALICTADRCNGTGACIHPGGNAGAVCRPATQPCDAPETCTGASTSCPVDLAAPNGTSCADGAFCNGAETCQAGACTSGAPPCLACDEELDACPGDCPAVARAGCRAAEKSSFVIRRRASGNHRLVWRWLRGQATTHLELADPRTSAGYLLCIYEGAGATLTAQTLVPADAARWRARGGKGDQGFRYKDAAAALGVRRILVRPGGAGRAKASVVGSGAALPDPSLPFDLPVQVQLSNDASGLCLGSTFTSAKRNDSSVFRR